jgi:hypothetical protein
MHTSTGSLHGACLKKDLVNQLGRYAVEAELRDAAAVRAAFQRRGVAV